MIVVANASPLMNLAVVGELELLRRVYEKVVIPEAVEQELYAFIVHEAGE